MSGELADDDRNNRDDLAPCPNCSGEGVEDDGGLDAPLCHLCGGTGLVDDGDWEVVDDQIEAFGEAKQP